MGRSTTGNTYPVSIAGGGEVGMDGSLNSLSVSVSSGTHDPMADIAWAILSIRERRVGYVLHTDYYHGRHRLVFATDRWKNTFGPIFRKFFDNVCRTVVDVTVDKLQVKGFSDVDADQDDTDVPWRLWQNLHLQRKSQEVHTEALRCGDAFVIVQKDELTGEVEVYPQKSDNMAVRYDPDHPDKLEFAFKWWALSDGRVRANLYYPDVTLKYVTRNSSQSDLPRSYKSFVEWDEAPMVPNPTGQVPVFHFANRAETGEMGLSELEDVVPLQDALNKSILDLLISMEFVSFPQRYAIGLEVDTDPDTGAPIQPFTPGVDRLWTTGSTETSFGQFPQADLSQFISIMENMRLEVARVSGTPVHYLMLSATNFPSGEAMKTAEARHTAKVNRLLLAWGEQWEEMMAYVLSLDGTPMPANADLQTQWEPVEPRSEQVFYTNLAVKSQLGVPDYQLQREMGYSEDQIEEFAQAKAQSDLMTAQLNSMLFNQGQQPPAAGGQGQPDEAQQQQKAMQQGQVASGKPQLPGPAQPNNASVRVARQGAGPLKGLPKNGKPAKQAAK